MEKMIQLDGSKETDQVLFEYLWDGIIAGGSKGEVRDRKSLRGWAAIQRKLQSISIPDPNFNLKTGKPIDGFKGTMRPPSARNLKEGIQSVSLEVGQVDEIISRIEKVPWGGAQEIQVADLIDFLSAAPEVKKET